MSTWIMTTDTRTVNAEIDARREELARDWSRSRRFDGEYDPATADRTAGSAAQGSEPGRTGAAHHWWTPLVAAGTRIAARHTHA